MKKNYTLFLMLVLIALTTNAQITLTQSVDNTTVDVAGSACWDASIGEYRDNSFMRAYNLADFSITEDFEITSVEYGQGGADDGKIITCNIYTATSDDLTTATLALVGTANHISTAANDLGLVSVALSASIPAGSTIVFEVFAADSGTNTGESFFPGINAGGENDDSYILSNDCGITVPTTTTAVGFPDNQYVMNVVGDISCENNITFCYVDNDTTEYTFTNEDGAPLTVIFNEGQVENNSDELIVLDSDGVTNLNEATPYGDGGNIEGLTFTSSEDTITISVQSDGLINCQDNGYTPINFSILTCLEVVGLIEVNAFIDENSNAVFDTSEINFSDGVFTYEINNDGIINYVNSSTGNFIIPNYDDSITYDISFIMYEDLFSCLNQSFTLVENVSTPIYETVHVDFPLTPITDCSDVGVYLLSYIPPRPGITYYNTLIVENNGTQLPVSGSVEFTHDPLLSLLDVLDIDAGNSITTTATGFILNFNDLQPDESEVVTIRLNVPTSAMSGDIVTNSVVYSVSDLNIDNNESSLTEVVVNSYDPNNKLESHGPEIIHDDFSDDDYLFYTINFQNLGTAEALDIRVEDMLDSQLDVSTFKMLISSHDYVLTRVDNNLTWEFEDVNLPSESMDEPNSHGYIYFKIKPVTGFVIGDIIPNTADIYFDFNSAIVTNTFETEFVENNLSVVEFLENPFILYPNPANDEINIQFSQLVGENIEVAIYDIQGKLVMHPKDEINENKIQLNVSGLSQGMYFVELSSDNFKTVKKLIIE